MKFYNEIAKYYDDIFKENTKQIDLISKVVGQPPKSILDVASGTGGPSIALREKGHMVTAIDLNSSMIDKLKSKSLKVISYVMNMLNIDKLNSKFDLIYCVGNSLVHLEDLEEVETFISKVHKSLNDNGNLLIQIINYDRILDKNIKSLPTIENKDKNLVFERYYDYDVYRQKIEFKTVLKTKDREYGNKVYLLPIRKNELDSILKKVGFKDIEYFGTFDQKSFIEEESFHLIALAKK